jgi:hypothetical protein
VLGDTGSLASEEAGDDPCEAASGA